MVADAPLFLGVDGGGTRCRARLTDAQGRRLGEGEAGSANIRLGHALAWASIMAATDAALAQAGLQRGDLVRCRAGLGLAGVLEPQDGAAMADASPVRWANLCIVSDAQAACLGAFSGGEGGIVIAGTGSAAFAWLAGRGTTLGGWGLALSDEGSAASVGRGALRLALLAHDGMLQAQEEGVSTLAAALLQRWGGQPEALAHWSASAHPADYAALAPLVFAHAETGDPLALQTVRAAALAIDAHIAALHRLGAPRICLLGGMAGALRPWLAPTSLAAITRPDGDAMDGAWAMARQGGEGALATQEARSATPAIMQADPSAPLCWQGARLFDGMCIREGQLITQEGAVAAILPLGDQPPAGCRTQSFDRDWLLVPGFIDIQVNGGGGVLFNDDPGVEACLALADAHRRFGTTGLLPTLISDSAVKMRAAVQAVEGAAALTKQQGRGWAEAILGLHLEGPFLAQEKSGVHGQGWLRAMDADDRHFLGSLPRRFAPWGRVVLSLAPEVVDLEDIRALAAAGLLLCGGHSCASYERTQAALAAGLRGFTHLFNAMPPLAGREPGILGAALACAESWCSLIVDGQHVHPAALRLALRLKPRGKALLVTDAMPSVGGPGDGFWLQGQWIAKSGDRLLTQEGKLAGAHLSMSAAMRQTVHALGVGLEEALRMASLYPAEFLGLAHERGRLIPGMRADIVALDGSLCVRGTALAGQWQEHDADGDSKNANLP
jgi:N-acetylglucosamine-6-phosphate deacetylase